MLLLTVVHRTVIATTADEIATLRLAWERLKAPTVFQTFAWNHAVAQVFTAREAPHVIYTESDNGASLIPACVAGDRLTLAGESLADYRDVLAQGDLNVLEAGWAKAAELGLKFSTGAVRADCNQVQWEGFTLSPYYSAPLVSCQQITADAFASEHNRLGRWKRRLEREGAQFRCHSGSNSSLVRQIYQEKGMQPAEAGESLFADAQRVECMVQSCAALGPQCEIFTFETAGTLVASLVTFREPGIRRFYTIQFDQAWAKYSPGMVLIYEITYRSLVEGLDCDYMTGEQGYKMRFATSVVPMYWAEASPQVLSSLPKRHALAA